MAIIAIMTRRFRRFIFLIFTALFIMCSFAAVLFAEGYRFDFSDFKLVKTGGIFIKTSTDGAKIYINDKYIESTNGILTHSVLISGLAPKNYNVFVYKENYYPWNKVVKVENGMVSELDSILLFPLELKKNKIAELSDQTISEFEIIDSAVKIKNNKAKTLNTYNLNDGKLLTSEKFSAKGGPASGWKTTTSSPQEIISPDKNKKLYVLNNRIWVEYLKNITKDPIKNAGEKELLAIYEPPIDFFEWFGDSKHVMWFADNELNVAELDNRGGKRNSINFYLGINPPFFWDRENSELYFFEKSAGKSVLYKISFKS
ncbi:PEGA domain-containing protein [Candidatus Azambacteria bacterium]|nr:PEGA domain-containing protein [Candidatus Azambacteria bacterium]